MRFVHTVLRLFLLLVAAVLLVASLAAFRVRAAEPPNADDVERVTPQEIERIAELEKALTNSALVGHFTITGEEDSGKLSKERYELGEVKHLEKDQWLIQARIKYGEHDLTLPLTLPIRWAGDTPMICVDEMPIPGLGTFTARVMIYRDHYAGFWTGMDHGGHLFGVIERGKKDAAAEKVSSADE